MEGVTIRLVKTEDFEAIHRLSLELGYSYPKEKMKDRIRYIVEHTGDIVLVAEEESGVTGYIHASPYELMYQDPIMNILGFVVKEEKRGRGIGHLLITELEKRAEERGFMGIRLTSGDYRTGAHRFYERHGYTTTKTSKKYTKELLK
jgi:predicted N-acetyltransferase YhbS